MDERLKLEEIQGIVKSGYRHLPAAAYVLLTFERSARDGVREWLGRLADQITTCDKKGERESINVALTYTGLEHLGVPKTMLDTFPLPFVEGMTSARRASILGDNPVDATSDALGWGGPRNPVDGMVMVYAENAERLSARIEEIRSKTNARCRVLDTQSYADRREHFGFADGLSQPMIAGLHDKKCRRENPSNVVNSGEFILGYRNEYGYAAEAPKLGDDGDLGRDGTYLVFRQTRQDVAAFRDFLKQNAPGDAAEQERLGAKMVGRWKNGTPLIASPFREDLDFKPTAEHANDFGFAGDPKGFACPLGAHIRRANPRDSASLGSPKDAVHRSNRHRLLRRGRPYGRRIDDDQATPETERGLHFIALCSDLERQFEFVAQTWIGNPAFEELDEVDPLVGGQCPGPTFTVQAPFGRRRVTGLTSFVQLVGGAYFFVPSRSAVRWLASGATTANPGNAAARNGGRHEAAQAGLPQKTAPWVSTAFGRNCRNAIAAARPPGWRPSTSARADRPTAPEPSEGILPVGKSVQTDTMTGLANRAGLMLELETIIERSKHDGSPFALLYMDVDNFKYVNDTRGHSVGDEPLKAVGETLHGCVREGDLAGRLGGDEFVVLIPHCDQPQAAALADRVFAKLTSTVVNKERPAGFWSAWPAFRKLPSMYPKHFSCRPNDVRGKAQRQKSGRHAFSLTAGAGL